MQQFIIEGGHPLNGTIRASGNKNAALKMLAACLLTDEPVTLRNMPDIGDARTLIEIMRRLGVSIHWLDDSTLRVHAKTVTFKKVLQRLSVALCGSIEGVSQIFGRVWHQLDSAILRFKDMQMAVLSVG